MHDSPSSEDVLAFWFGELDPDGLVPQEWRQRWWKKDPAFDASIRERFGPTYDAIVAGALQGWLDAPKSGLAYVVVLDQFSRNMFRDQASMYAADARALSAATQLLDAGADQDLAPAEAAFVVMPLMHDETLAAQDRCIAEFARLRDQHPVDSRVWSSFDGYRGYAVKHRDIVAEWGRFPHRNAILSRESTPEELAFLDQPGSSF